MRRLPARARPPLVVNLVVLATVITTTMLLVRWAQAFRLFPPPPTFPRLPLRRPSLPPALTRLASTVSDASSLPLPIVNKAKDYMIEINDVTLPGEPVRQVHVLDTGPCSCSTNDVPPLVLIGGTAQVIASWLGHIQALAKDRRLIIYEARGQGRRTDLDLEQACLTTHIEDFRRIHAALQLDGPVDLCGFSFGGRVSLGVAAQAPELVRRLVLTGVPAEREAVGRLILQSWKSALRQGRLHEFAWNSMLQCHGPAFLTKYEANIPEWVDFVEKANTAEGILSIVEKSQTLDIQNPLHTLQLAKQVQAPTLLMGGADDRVASALEIERLAAEAGRGWEVILIQGTGHNCVFENSLVWREEVVRFLS